MPPRNATPTALTIRTPRQQRGRDRVAALLAAAAAVFARRSYHAATMTEIAAEAAASIGSLYLFFPTKPALAQALLANLADQLSARLDALPARLAAHPAAHPAATVADALFAELAAFLHEHPAYTALLDHTGDDTWRQAVRARRRTQIAALFALAAPPLPPGQPERLALLVPALMRAVLAADDAATRTDLLAEARAMLRHHLTTQPGSAPN